MGNLFSNITTFKNVSKKLKKLFEEKKVSLFIQQPFFADFTIDNEDFSEEETKIIANEIEPIFSYKLADYPKNNERLRDFLPFNDEKLTDEVIELFWEKYNFITKVFYSQNVEHLLKTRKLSKHFIFQDLTWEINKKRTNSSNVDASFDYATISIKGIDNTSGGPRFFFPYAPFDNLFGKTTSFCFDCHIIELDYLINQLKEVKDLLEDGYKDD